MERISIQMDDPVFLGGVAKTAVVSININPSGLSCTAELYLLDPVDLSKQATSGLKAFTSTGLLQNINLPITTPTTGGRSYPVYLDVFVQSQLVAAYKATENVIIPGIMGITITWS